MISSIHLQIAIFFELPESFTITLTPRRDQFRFVENLAADCASICTRKFEIPRVHLENETS